VLQNLVQKESLGQKRRVAQEKMNQTAAAAFFSLGLTLAQGQEPARARDLIFYWRILSAARDNRLVEHEMKPS